MVLVEADVIGGLKGISNECFIAFCDDVVADDHVYFVAVKKRGGETCLKFAKEEITGITLGHASTSATIRCREKTRDFSLVFAAGRGRDVFLSQFEGKAPYDKFKKMSSQPPSSGEATRRPPFMISPHINSQISTPKTKQMRLAWGNKLSYGVKLPKPTNMIKQVKYKKEDEPARKKSPYWKADRKVERDMQPFARIGHPIAVSPLEKEEWSFDSESEESSEDLEAMIAKIDKKCSAGDSRAKKRMGFANTGNSCYMNAILEALSSIDCFRADICGLAIRPLLREDGLYNSFYKIMLARESDDRALLNLSSIKNAVEEKHKNFLGAEQQDAHEFLCACFDILKEELLPFIKGEEKQINIEDIPSILNFSGSLDVSSVCTQCNHLEVSQEDFYFLSIPLPEQKCQTPFSVQDGIDLYFEDEEIEMRCALCTGQRAKRIPKLSSLPRIIIIQLQRFRFDTKSLTLSKVKEKISVNPTILLRKHCTEIAQNPVWFKPVNKLLGYKRIPNLFVSSPSKQQKVEGGVGSISMIEPSITRSGTKIAQDDKEPTYSLLSVVSHHGTVTQGHYTCNISKENYWEHCNDSIVSRWTKEKGIKAAEDGYLLFYIHNHVLASQKPKNKPRS